MRAGDANVTRPQHDVLLSDAKVTLAVAGIRGGKTHVGALATIRRAIEKPTDLDQCHAVVSPTFPMSKWGPEAKLHKLLHDRAVFPVSPLVTFAASERTFYIANALGSLSKIRIFSGEDPDRWRGDSWLSWWGDEAARLKRYAWDVGLGRLADTDGPALFTTTPNGHNFIYDLAKEAQVERDAPGYVHRVSKSARVRVVSWASTFNVFLARVEAFAELKERYDPETYAQEVLAQFIAKTGRVYKAFEREKHVIDRPFKKDQMVWVGQDFNVARMASVLMQDDLATNAMHVIDEIEIHDADTHGLVRRLAEWRQKHGLDRERMVVVPDASSRKRQTAGSDTAKSDLHILEQAGLRVEGPRSNPPVKDRVNTVNGLLYNSKLTVSPRAKLLIEALEKQAWDEDGEPEKDGILDNRVDALGYVCWFRYPLRVPRATIARRVA